ncbi:hypothetical protein B0H10DRAFT_1957061 [Mycena sp. CBHHK59/15]|nr:hypothetical protein B0H10DRAFT_1957061 [Mycena sp. CBHHK59/15]
MAYNDGKEGRKQGQGQERRGIGAGVAGILAASEEAEVGPGGAGNCVRFAAASAIIIVGRRSEPLAGGAYAKPAALADSSVREASKRRRRPRPDDVLYLEQVRNSTAVSDARPQYPGSPYRGEANLQTTVTKKDSDKLEGKRWGLASRKRERKSPPRAEQGLNFVHGPDTTLTQEGPSTTGAACGWSHSSASPRRMLQLSLKSVAMVPYRRHEPAQGRPCAKRPSESTRARPSNYAYNERREVVRQMMLTQPTPDANDKNAVRFAAVGSSLPTNSNQSQCSSSRCSHIHARTRICIRMPLLGAGGALAVILADLGGPRGPSNMHWTTRLTSHHTYGQHSVSSISSTLGQAISISRQLPNTYCTSTEPNIDSAYPKYNIPPPDTNDGGKVRTGGEGRKEGRKEGQGRRGVRAGDETPVVVILPVALRSAHSSYLRGTPLARAWYILLTRAREVDSRGAWSRKLDKT